MNLTRDYGAFVISLDLESYWGVRDDLGPDSPYRTNLRGERAAISSMLELLEEYNVAATWAAVGFLFAKSHADRERLSPAILPEYQDRSLSPYSAAGLLEQDEQLLYAPDVIEAIRRTPRQEIATHTFSHYYCCVPGQTREAFRADIESAINAAREIGLEIRSIVFPRNQHNPAYDDILADNGIICYRGNQKANMYQFGVKKTETTFNRMSRLADSYINLSGRNTYGWEDVWTESLANVPASVFLRPISGEFRVLNDLQYKRIVRSLEEAASRRRIFHLWWHPHNFGAEPERNIAFLRRVLDAFRGLRDEFGMRSLTMAETAEMARAGVRV